MVLPVITAAGRMVVGRAIRNVRTGPQQPQFTGERPSFILYMVIGMFALLKDTLDIFFGVIPGVGIALCLVLGMCFSIIVFLILTIFDRSGERGNVRIARLAVRRAVVFFTAAGVGGLPVIGFFPEMTLAIIVLYALAWVEWKKGAGAAPLRGAVAHA